MMQLVVAGLAVGSIYGLIGLGFVIIHNVSNVVNLSQGEFVMLSGMMAASLVSSGWPWYFAILASILAVALVGAALDYLIIARRRSERIIILMLLTLAFDVILRGAALLIWDKEDHTLTPITNELLRFGEVAIPSQYLWICGVVLVAFGLLTYFYRKTRTGIAMLAVASNRRAALLCGVRAQSVIRIAFIVSASLSALGGILITPVTYISYDVGIDLAVKGFAAAIVGGLASPAGAVVGGWLFGLVETISAGYISSQYKDGIVLLVFLSILLLFPQGLFRRTWRGRV